ncbi:hypothetical protein EC957_005849, partial [Mortierella hygrophila]
MGLEKLDIVIRVPFKTNLDHVQCLDRARIETRVTHRTATEKEAHANLAQHRDLVKINFGWSYTYDNI